ncbi:unnamed protein product [Cyprideis torosa]|uniref:Uncharacterized protein n=1 Tax=Cyprideis torosa TaxID=163714 RepID=A0A7R8WIP2_9CRUS|nr:unnamed protein product [Cyprideis torosa]CAG0895026.1 unnamed protein product [Cyprideis torosa]
MVAAERKSLVHDLKDLTHVDEKAVSSHLQRRASAGQFFSSIGAQVLVSLNPLREIPGLFDEDERNADPSRPHLWRAADEAREWLWVHSKSVILMHGRTGAGKSYGTRRLLQRLLQGPTTNSLTPEGLLTGNSLESLILDAEKVLEAFGNAATIHNKNSSRFGKFIELTFSVPCVSRGSRVQGASVRTYLLERTRVSGPPPGEKNFHIFYQFLSSESQQLHCENPVYTIAPGFSYSPELREDFETTMNSLTRLGFPQQELSGICSTLWGLLRLGEIHFAHDNVADRWTVAGGSSSLRGILGVSEMALAGVLTSQQIAPGHGRRVSVYARPCQSREECEARRDTLMRVLYQNLFRALVVRIGSSLGEARERSFREEVKTATIGILDMYGFEVYEAGNSLEQLCINYANERLQHLFNSVFIKEQMEEFALQGLQEAAMFHDTEMAERSESCLDLLHGPISVFSHIDQQSLLRMGKSWTLFCELERSLSSHRLFSLVAIDRRRNAAPGKASPQRSLAPARRLMVGSEGFLIRHYAQDVAYSVQGLLERNRDQVSSDICELLQRSKNQWVAGIFSPEPSTNLTLDSASPLTPRPTRRKATVLSKFKASLDELLKDLCSSQIFYVRCLHPSNLQDQVRTSGILQAIVLARAGFPISGLLLVIFSVRSSAAWVRDRWASDRSWNVGREDRSSWRDDVFQHTFEMDQDEPSFEAEKDFKSPEDVLVPESPPVLQSVSRLPEFYGLKSNLSCFSCDSDIDPTCESFALNFVVDFKEKLRLISPCFPGQSVFCSLKVVNGPSENSTLMSYSRGCQGLRDEAGHLLQEGCKDSSEDGRTTRLCLCSKFSHEEFLSRYSPLVQMAAKASALLEAAVLGAWENSDDVDKENSGGNQTPEKSRHNLREVEWSLRTSTPLRARNGKFKADPVTFALSNDSVPSGCSLRPNLVFLKIPKTGSMTFSTIMDRLIVKHQLLLATPPISTRLSSFSSNEEFKRCMFQDGSHSPPSGRANILYHHTILGGREMDTVVGPNPVRVTLIRHPVNQVMSFWNHARSFDHEGMTLGWPVSNNCELKEYLANPSNCWPGIMDFVFWFDMQSKYLNVYSSPVTSELENIVVGLNDYFDLVMLTERYDESLILLKDLLCLEWDDVMYKKANVKLFTANRPTLTIEERIKILEKSHTDWFIYKYFSRQLEAKIEIYGRERMKKDLAYFRARNKEWGATHSLDIDRDLRETIHQNKRRVQKLHMEQREQKPKNILDFWNGLHSPKKEMCPSVLSTPTALSPPPFMKILLDSRSWSALSEHRAAPPRWLISRVLDTVVSFPSGCDEEAKPSYHLGTSLVYLQKEPFHKLEDEMQRRVRDRVHRK